MFRPGIQVARRSLSLSKLKPDFSKLKFPPQAPGGVTGGPNDAFVPPKADWFEGSFHWEYEKITAVSLIPMIAVPFYGAFTGAAVEYPVLDALLSTTLLMHVQMGLTACIVDYIPKRKYGVWHDFCRWLLFGGTAVGLYGIYEIETSENGVCDLVKKLWKDQEENLYRFRTR